MSKTINIFDIEYEEFEQIRDEILRTSPNSLINDIYDRNQKKAWFHIDDEFEYIVPSHLKYYISL